MRCDLRRPVLASLATGALLTIAGSRSLSNGPNTYIYILGGQGTSAGHKQLNIHGAALVEWRVKTQMNCPRPLTFARPLVCDAGKLTSELARAGNRNSCSRSIFTVDRCTRATQTASLKKQQSDRPLHGIRHGARCWPIATFHRHDHDSRNSTSDPVPNINGAKPREPIAGSGHR